MEEFEGSNLATKHPSLPANYVTLAMLKERWLQRKKEEEEQLKQQQRNLRPEPNEESSNGSKHSSKPAIRNQNRLRLGRNQPGKDLQGSMKEYEELKSSDSVLIPENRGIRETNTKMGYRERRKPRSPRNLECPANVAAHIVSNEENGGKDEGSELQLSENAVEKGIPEASGRERSGRRKGGGRFKKNRERLKKLKAQRKAEEELGEMEKKDEIRFLGLAQQEGKDNGEKEKQSGTGSFEKKIGKSFQDLLLDDRKHANVKTRVTHLGEKKAEGRDRNGGGQRQRYFNDRKAPSRRVGNQLMWVKKAETLGGHVASSE
ncbi:unnamed protein product [Cuscuta epithymum]|uniref:Uncharacterized protein n=1 Tax=Cuscuta epithymum TaxID=186058 RepID=A0AAV0GCD3_9ASTE|nr:unnamed protein product [Cuscuta epithymum]